MSPVKYELGFYITEDDILQSQCPGASNLTRLYRIWGPQMVTGEDIRPEGDKSQGLSTPNAVFADIRPEGDKSQGLSTPSDVFADIRPEGDKSQGLSTPSDVFVDVRPEGDKSQGLSTPSAVFADVRPLAARFLLGPLVIIKCHAM
jgi:hypothetical protein